MGMGKGEKQGYRMRNGHGDFKGLSRLMERNGGNKQRQGQFKGVCCIAWGVCGLYAMFCVMHGWSLKTQKYSWHNCFCFLMVSIYL